MIEAPLIRAMYVTKEIVANNTLPWATDVASTDVATVLNFALGERASHRLVFLQDPNLPATKVGFEYLTQQRERKISLWDEDADAGDPNCNAMYPVYQ
jgi:hypothetical protein